MIMNRHALAKDKVEKLKLGYSTFAESKEVATLIEQEINALQLNVYIHKTLSVIGLFRESAHQYKHDSIPHLNTSHE